MASAAITLFSPQTEGLPAGFEPRLAVVRCAAKTSAQSAWLGSVHAWPLHVAFVPCRVSRALLQSVGQPGQRSRCPLCRARFMRRCPIEARAVSGLPIEVMCVPGKAAAAISISPIASFIWATLPAGPACSMCSRRMKIVGLSVQPHVDIGSSCALHSPS